MICSALELLQKSVQGYLKNFPELNIGSQDKVILSYLGKNDQPILDIPSESVGLTLVNVEEERTVKSQISFRVNGDGQIAHINPDLKINLYILFAANFGIYKSALRYLSCVIRFFQSKNVFLAQNTPEMDPKIEKLIVEMYTLNFEQQHHLWGILGTKYLPSIMYKVRLLLIQEGLTQKEGKPIHGIDEKIHRY